ncbi:glycoside hydrolase family 43 protein [Salipaludibacillus neizhouensis]
MKRKKSLIVLMILGILLSVGSPASAAFWEMNGNTFTHDPTLIKEDNYWYQFYTGEGLKVSQAGDNMNWREVPQIFPEPLSWWSDYVPNQNYNDVWAPDIQYYNGKYWLYYSVSEFGENTSAIGLMSADRIDAGNWRDEGMVINSSSSDNFNALDPNLVIDENGEPWLAFGSFWSGLKVTKLDPATMKPNGGAYHSIAARPNNNDAIENPNITYKDGYYYLFTSIDKCCDGVNSTYKITVGRSENITGPYYDKNGVNMLYGGGTIFDGGNERFPGVGGQFVYNNNIFVRHAYDADDNGVPKLLINDLYWDNQGWPRY